MDYVMRSQQPAVSLAKQVLARATVIAAIAAIGAGRSECQKGLDPGIRCEIHQ